MASEEIGIHRNLVFRAIKELRDVEILLPTKRKNIYIF